jgi:hypothetical protein
LRYEKGEGRKEKGKGRKEKRKQPSLNLDIDLL